MHDATAIRPCLLNCKRRLILLSWPIHTTTLVFFVPTKSVGCPRRCYDQALSIKFQKAPGSLDLALTLFNLGVVCDISYYQPALIIQMEKAPNSLVLANTYQGLGVVFRKQNLRDTGQSHDTSIGRHKLNHKILCEVATACREEG